MTQICSTNQRTSLSKNLLYCLFLILKITSFPHLQPTTVLTPQPAQESYLLMKTSIQSTQVQAKGGHGLDFPKSNLDPNPNKWIGFKIHIHFN